MCYLLHDDVYGVVYPFPRAAVTNYHKLKSLKQQMPSLPIVKSRNPESMLFILDVVRREYSVILSLPLMSIYYSWGDLNYRDSILNSALSL